MVNLDPQLVRDPRVLRLAAAIWLRAGAALLCAGLLLLAAGFAAGREAERQERIKAQDDKGVSHVRN